MTAPLVFLLYASRDGHTCNIISCLETCLKAQDQGVLVYNIEKKEPSTDMLNKAAFIMIVSPVRYGTHLGVVDLFVKKYKSLLRKENLGLVSINLTARKADKNTPETNPYYKKWLRRHKIEPALQAVIAGKLDYQLYSWWDRLIIRLIMRMTGGPTHPHTAIDYTNWGAVEALASEMVNKIDLKKQEAA